MLLKLSLSTGPSWPPPTRRICSPWIISLCGIAEQLRTQLESFCTTCPDKRPEVEDRETHTFIHCIFLKKVQHFKLKISLWQVNHESLHAAAALSCSPDCVFMFQPLGVVQYLFNKLIAHSCFCSSNVCRVSLHHCPYCSSNINSYSHGSYITSY